MQKKVLFPRKKVFIFENMSNFRTDIFLGVIYLQYFIVDNRYSSGWR